jgi:hypothetical protein
MKPQKLYPYRDNQALDKDLTQIFDFISRGDVVTTAPNGSKSGKKGEFVFYNNSGTFSLWVNTTSSTVWQQI